MTPPPWRFLNISQSKTMSKLSDEQKKSALLEWIEQKNNKDND